MSEPVAQQLIDAQHSRVTLTIDGEEYDGYLDYLDYAPYRDGPDYLTPDEGEIFGTFELSDDEFDARDLPTLQVSIMARETSPGEWDEPNASVWAPEVVDGEAVRDDWEGLGTVEAVSVREDA